MTQAVRDFGATEGFNILATAQKIWLDEIGSAVISALEDVEVAKELTPEKHIEAIHDAINLDYEIDRPMRNWYGWNFDGAEFRGGWEFEGWCDSDWPALPYKHYDL